jgi:hypothetical protein
MVVPNDKVLIIACGALAPDLVRVRELNGWDHIDFQCLPAELHNKPQLIPDEVRKKIQQNRHQYNQIFIGYSDCGTGGLLDNVLKEEQVERLPGAHCYEMFAGSNAFSALAEAELGTFYLTDFLARHFQRVIVKGLGIDRFPELKEQYFAHYKKLVYLAQLNDPEIEQQAVVAADFLGLTYEKVATGDGFLENTLAVKVGAPTRSCSGRASSGRASSGRASSGRASSGRASSGRASSGRASSGRASTDLAE